MRAQPLNYDSWFDYIRLEESAGDIERTREVRWSRAAAWRAASARPPASALAQSRFPVCMHTTAAASASPPRRCSQLALRQVYERAISNVPPAPEKRYWQRYIYLWIKYALFEELEAGERSPRQLAPPPPTIPSTCSWRWVWQCGCGGQRTVRAAFQAPPNTGVHVLFLLRRGRGARAQSHILSCIFA